MIVNRTDIAEALLEAKANPHGAKAIGVSPLVLASRGNRMNFAGLLLKYKADGADQSLARASDAKIDKGTTPLLTSILGGHLEIVKMLIEARADIQTPMKFSVEAPATSGGLAPKATERRGAVVNEE